MGFSEKKLTFLKVQCCFLRESNGWSAKRFFHWEIAPKTKSEVPEDGLPRAENKQAPLGPTGK